MTYYYIDIIFGYLFNDYCLIIPTDIDYSEERRYACIYYLPIIQLIVMKIPTMIFSTSVCSADL